MFDIEWVRKIAQTYHLPYFVGLQPAGHFHSLIRPSLVMCLLYRALPLAFLHPSLLINALTPMFVAEKELVLC